MFDYFENLIFRPAPFYPTPLAWTSKRKKKHVHQLFRDEWNQLNQKENFSSLCPLIYFRWAFNDVSYLVASLRWCNDVVPLMINSSCNYPKRVFLSINYYYALKWDDWELKVFSQNCLFSRNFQPWKMADSIFLWSFLRT